MGMFITKIQINKTTSPKEYVTGEKKEIFLDENGKNYIMDGRKRIDVNVQSFSSFEELKKFVKVNKEKK